MKKKSWMGLLWGPYPYYVESSFVTVGLSLPWKVQSRTIQTKS